MTPQPQQPEPEQYDVIVLGAGPTGENLADRAKAAGLSTVVVESQLVGGECSYWACMPSKALLRPAAALAHARALPGARQAVTDGLDPAAVLARRDEFTSHWHDDGQVQWLRDTGIDLVRGHGRLAGERAVLVDGTRLLTARHAVAVCTGTRAALPHLPGLAEAHPWTSRDAVSYTHLIRDRAGRRRRRCGGRRDGHRLALARLRGDAAGAGHGPAPPDGAVRR